MSTRAERRLIRIAQVIGDAAADMLVDDGDVDAVLLDDLETACVADLHRRGMPDPAAAQFDGKEPAPRTNAMPMQPIILDEDGRARFRANGIVRFLLDAGPFDLDQIARLPNITREEREQFAQLIGYSINGFGELKYASPEAVAKADAIADLIEPKQKAKTKAKTKRKEK